MAKNIVEKYIEIVGQFVIGISGLPGCGKQTLGENLARDLKFKLINTYDFYKKPYDEKIMLKGGDGEEMEIVNWYTDDAIDWDALNIDIEKYKKTGVVLVGMSLPFGTSININIDYHIHLNISKQVSMEKIHQFISDNKDTFPEDYAMLDTVFEKLKMNKLIYPYYLEATKNARILKYITVKEMNNDELYDMAFDVLMQWVQGYLNKNIKGEKGEKGESKKKSQNLDIKLELLDEPKYTYDEELDMIKKLEGEEDYDELEETSSISDS